MTRRRLIPLLAVLAATLGLSIALPALADGQDGIGGTGVRSVEGGIGGTGVRSADGGIGGTGIIGTITAFGSIHVNGLAIGYADDIPVSILGETADPGALAVGQVVSVEAEGSGDILTARSIAVRHAVAGPVTGIDAGAETIEVLGQTVRVSDDTLAAADIEVGRMVAVSGLRRPDGVIEASRLDSRRADAPVLLTGPVSAVEAGGFTVGGLRVEKDAATVPADLAAGDLVTVRGWIEGGSLRAQHLDRAPARPFAGRMARLSIEGFLNAGAGGRDFRIGRFPIRPQVTVAPLSPRELRLGRRVILDGGPGRAGLVARQLKIHRFVADPRARRKLLLRKQRFRERGIVPPRRTSPPSVNPRLRRPSPGVAPPRAIGPRGGGVIKRRPPLRRFRRPSRPHQPTLRRSLSIRRFRRLIPTVIDSDPL